jgi:GH15 family glucan-1,4-alpha-glucosidase
MMAQRIEDYALIGDCKTAALVGRDGSIDWLCWPRFDSAACFAALLGTSENGRWLIAPAEQPVAVTRRYRPGTLILETEFQTAGGSATLVDFMALEDGAHLLRIVMGRTGHVDFRTEFVVRFNYGSAVPWVTRLDDGTINAIAGPERLVLRTPVALHGEDLRTRGEFAVASGESIAFVLSYGLSFASLPPAIDPLMTLQETERLWRGWSDRCPDVGPWTETVKRSLITLKALTYAPSGGMVAAATTSLPEQLGGVRNWDYRYCWLRDATFTLQAFMHLGYYDEARAWRDWIVRAIAGSPDQIQIMYGVGGERWLPELTVPWLPGYENSSPVRIGNGAHRQLQIDVFGEGSPMRCCKPTMAGWTIPSGPALCGPWSWTIWRGPGARRTKAFGRCAAVRNISSIRKSWLGSPSIARSNPRPAKLCHGSRLSALIARRRKSMKRLTHYGESLSSPPQPSRSRSRDRSHYRSRSWP